MDSAVWLPKIIRRISQLLFITALLVFSTFIIGNLQGFLDITQFILLNIFEITALIFIVSGLYHIIISIVFLIKGLSKNYAGIILTIAAEILIIIMFILVNIIISLAKTVS